MQLIVEREKTKTKKLYQEPCEYFFFLTNK